MAIEFACPSCGNRIQASNDQAGVLVSCPHCSTNVTVPAPKKAAGVIQFACPACGSSFRVPATMAGKKGKCPDCKAPIEIPVQAAPAPAAPRPAPAPAPRPAAPAPVETFAEETVIEPPAEAYVEPEPSPAPSPTYTPTPAPRKTAAREEKPEKEKPSYAPSKKGMPITNIVVLGLCGVFILVILIALLVHMSKEANKPPEQAAQLSNLLLSYKEATDEITVKNGSDQPWTNTSIEIFADGGPFSFAQGSVPPAANVVIPINKFASASGGRLDTVKTQPKSMAISATLPDGTKAGASVMWPARPAASSSTPAAPATPPAAPGK